MSGTWLVSDLGAQASLPAFPGAGRYHPQPTLVRRLAIRARAVFCVSYKTHRDKSRSIIATRGR